MSSIPSPGDTGPLHEHPRGVALDVLIQPRASRTELAGVHGGALRIRVAAPPVDGAANAALIEYVSRLLAVRRADIEFLRGESGRRKQILLVGLRRQDIAERLGLE